MIESWQQLKCAFKEVDVNRRPPVNLILGASEEKGEMHLHHFTTNMELGLHLALYCVQSTVLVALPTRAFSVKLD